MQHQRWLPNLACSTFLDNPLTTPPAARRPTPAARRPTPAMRALRAGLTVPRASSGDRVAAQHQAVGRPRREHIGLFALPCGSWHADRHARRGPAAVSAAAAQPGTRHHLPHPRRRRAAPCARRCLGGAPAPGCAIVTAAMSGCRARDSGNVGGPATDSRAGDIRASASAAAAAAVDATGTAADATEPVADGTEVAPGAAAPPTVRPIAATDLQRLFQPRRVQQRRMLRPRPELLRVRRLLYN